MTQPVPQAIGPAYTVLVFYVNAAGEEVSLCEIPVPEVRWQVVVIAVLSSWRDSGVAVRADVHGADRNLVARYGYDVLDYPDSTGGD